MMLLTGIAQIQSFVQEYAEVIAQVLEVDVTIVDEECIRIAGTGPYKAKIGQFVPSGSLFQRIVQTGEHGIVRDQDRYPACRNCAIAAECLELATMGFPVVRKGKPIGVIGIMAVNREQKEKIIGSSDRLTDFLTHMSSLLESKLVLVEANHRLQDQVQAAMEVIGHNRSFGTMLGQSPAYRRLVEEAVRISTGTSTVLIRGESGTGKELLARAIHSAGERSGGPFVVVNCPSLPDNLLESELFGYEGGAFTGASRGGKPGKFELAQHGTIFLDEIGDLPLSLQPKLLRVIQERTVDRIGGREPIPVDVRVISATNRNLESMVESGAFRADLYYRLNVIPLFVPPLRERQEDIELYLYYFLRKYAQRLGKKIREVEPGLVQWFKDYRWPGNVRQLENVVEYLANMAQGDKVSFAEMPYNLVDNNLIDKENLPPSSGLSLEQRVAEFEKGLLAGYLPKGASLADKKRAAKELEISLATLYRRLEKYGLL
ncbi:sigma-54 interaction domain-containing protein [Acididesulfobacillus acetoxydans]|uniref:sigma-54 interaction domain-containing protein n=1 Tax=Acididesulfobacillus acetoxydans TaxID=1561005 RepID=UPI001F115A40|nr:sigma 54-interacting transcriptional regulator [Acididesulfobacillus acetoxydans]